MLLEVSSLRKYYPLTSGLLLKRVGDIKAVDGVSFGIAEGETLGLVGESGSGKTTLGKTLVGLEKPTAGRITYKGGKRTEIQMIFQDPQSSLDPKMTVGESIEEALLVKGIPEKERPGLVQSLLGKVGLEAGHAQRYPHELSGGQKQRISVARALAMDPKLIVADEPVSALDLCIQAQILDLLSELQRDLGLSYLFIAHNLRVIRYISQRVAVMYMGRIVELAPTDELSREPLHPYTRALLAAEPVPDPRQRGKKALPLTPSQLPATGEEPEFREVRRGHYLLCHRGTKEPFYPGRS